jgi:hypothetical protein
MRGLIELPHYLSVDEYNAYERKQHGERYPNTLHVLDSRIAVELTEPSASAGLRSHDYVSMSMRYRYKHPGDGIYRAGSAFEKLSSPISPKEDISEVTAEDVAVVDACMVALKRRVEIQVLDEIYWCVMDYEPDLPKDTHPSWLFMTRPHHWFNFMRRLDKCEHLKKDKI